MSKKEQHIKKRKRIMVFKPERSSSSKEIKFEFSSDGTIRIFDREGEIPITQKNKIEMYEREKSGKNKIIHNIDKNRLGVTFDEIEILREFNHVYAVDTNTKTINEDRISIGVYIKAKIFNNFVDLLESGYIRIINADENPEKISWVKLIEKIINDPEYDEKHEIAIIVDSDYENLDQYNSNTLPIIDDFYLPKNFKLIYATSDTGKAHFVTNKLISLCDKRANQIYKSMKNTE